MRERKDKETPNATHVYESVQRSIEVGGRWDASWGLRGALNGGHHALALSCLPQNSLPAFHHPATMTPFIAPSHPPPQDNIKEDELLPYIQEVLQLPLYDRDTGRAQ